VAPKEVAKVISGMHGQAFIGRLRRVALMLALVAGAALALAQSTEVVVGFSLPLTGGAANEGNETKAGAELAAKVINDAGGFTVGDSTVTLKLLFEDDKCNPQAATEAANRLVVGKAQYVGGSFCSSAALAEMPVLAALKVPQIVYAYADDLTGAARSQAGADLSVRLGPQARIEMAPLAKYAVEHEGHKTFFAMAQNTDFGRSMLAQFKATVEQLGGSFVAEPEYFPYANTDFRTILTKAKNSGADAIVAMGLGQEMIGITLQHDELGLTQPVFGSDLLEDRSVLSAVGDKSVGFFSPWFFEIGDTPTDMGLSVDVAPGAKALDDASMAQTGQHATRNNALGWGTIVLLKQAMERSGSTDPETVMGEVLSGDTFELPFGTYGFQQCGQADMRAGVAGYDQAGKILVAGRDYAGTDPVVLTSDQLCQ
jgi:branched-chain amino acid transport system substrate-binding protein